MKMPTAIVVCLLAGVTVLGTTPARALTVEEEAKLLASDGAAEDYFGASVSVSGDVAVVGAVFDDDNGNSSGSAYVYRRNGSSWMQEQKLPASDGAGGDYFGTGVSVSGDVAVVGANFDDDNGYNSGSAYVYRWNGSSWVQEQKLLASDGAAHAHFGGSVSMGGDVAVVGAAGSAYVFRWNGSGWVQEQKLLASDGTAADEFGKSVSVSGDVAVVGAWKDDDNGTDSGSAYVYRRDGSGWVQEQKLLASDGAAGDEFGNSISVSGDVAVVGAHWDDDLNPGSAYVYRWNGLSWVQEQKLVASDGTTGGNFGQSVSVSGDVAVVGRHVDDHNGFYSGSAYVFRWNGSSWVQEAKILASDGSAEELFGVSVSVSDDVAVVGALWDDDNGYRSGSAYVFRFLRCGDGFLDPGEECDDGNNVSCDGCSEICETEVGYICGDGILNTDCEECDDGNNVDGDGCDSNCTLTSCGNGILTDGEECDDGNNVSCDGCSPECVTEEGYVCGDGILNTDCGEQCDDGNNVDGDGCDSNCTLTSCGNGILTDGEECDDGNTVSCDGCSSNCVIEVGYVCGDGILNSDCGEECDDGNTVPCDGCSEICQNEVGYVCGDGILNPDCGEECDDGNVIPCDGCSEICGTEVGYICGDGILNTDCEECDDGNNVDGDGCAADCTIEHPVWPTAEEEAKLLASDGEVGDQFGVSVAVDGDTVVVGARGDDGGNFASCDCCDQAAAGITGCPSCAPCEATVCDLDPYCCVVLWDSICDIEAQQLCTCCFDQDPGYCPPGEAAAYMFTRTGDVWTEQAKLLASDGEEGDQFGVSVALDGGTAIIGASRADNNGVQSGSAYVFTRTGDVWTEQAKLLASDGNNIMRFGCSVALDGDTAVIGARSDDDNGLASGSAYVFTRTGGVWSEQAKLLASDGSSGDVFGHSVALDGGTAVIGALWEDDNGPQSGSAYVFTRTAGVWTEQTKLLASDGDAWNFFGSSVALDGHTAVIGALQGEGNGSLSGSAYVFTRTAGVWTEQAKLLASDGEEGDQFGVSVTLDGDTAVIGAWEDDDNGNDAGSAYLFTRTGDAWTEQAKMLASDGQAGDQFGASVALDGDTAVTGAYLDDDNSWSSGSAYVFRLLPCGDGILDPGEECDDGNNVSCDGCSEFCETEVGYVCGDGILNTDCEECDDGNTDPGDGCRADCTLEICGDGILDPQEGCDDGNNTSCDGCSSDCVIEEGYVCGDGILNTDCGEQCDDGNVFPCDGCSDVCEIEIGGVCGDGILNTDCEECDDGNDMDGDGCAADCTIEQDVPATTYRGMAVAALLLLVASTAFVLRRRATP